MEIGKNIFSLFLTFLVSLSMSVVSSDAATINAASASYSDVSAAVSAASSGDTVVVPAGSETWNSPLIIKKGLTFEGAGIGNTVITSNITDQNAGIVKYAPASPALNEPFRITGFTFDCNSKSNGLYLENNTTTIINKLRIDHNRIINPGGINAGRGIWIQGTIYGVIDNNTIEAPGGSAITSYGLNSTSWDNLSRDFGSANNIYFEDNTIIGSGTYHASGHGGRYVARYNNYSGVKRNMTPIFDIHGNQPAGYSTMVGEVYGNVIDLGGLWGGQLLDHRGGQAMVFNNNLIRVGQSSDSVKVREEYADADYPDPNEYLQHVTNSYYWGNRANTSTVLTAYISSDVYDGIHPNDPPVIVENREFWDENTSFDGTSGVGVGLYADRPAECTKGIGYWATDKGGNWNAVNGAANDGCLYKCTATNTWTLYYTAFPYPHPLRGISIPQNLHIVE
ncbi:MAG: hypothetical protein JW976_01710 [Syntrophaceae bacterium]|nr:hypothetical protein [Syntrophaceae bacterium]